MRMRNKPYAEDELRANPKVIFGPEPHEDPSGRWHEIFGNSNPLYLEIGTGKGKFAMDMSVQYPDVNIVAMEKIEEVLLFPAQFILDHNKNNLHLIYGDANYIIHYFTPGELDRIYINFPDPWRKKKHFKRRLTHHQFLGRYKQILKVGGELHFKTDDLELFHFTMSELPAHGFDLKNYTFDLHHSDYAAENITTGYEERWSAMGKRICQLVAVWNGN